MSVLFPSRQTKANIDLGVRLNDKKMNYAKNRKPLKHDLKL